MFKTATNRKKRLFLDNFILNNESFLNTIDS